MLWPFAANAGSPYAVPVLDGRLAIASGPGLHRAVAHMAATFTVDTSNTGGDAPLAISILSK